MHIGKKIKMLRVLEGLTQNELAEKIHKTRAMVSHIEQTGKVNHYTLQVLLKVLNVTEEEMESFTGKLYQVNAPAPHQVNDTSETEELKQKLDQGTKEIDMLKELVKSQKRIIKMLEKKKNKSGQK